MALEGTLKDFSLADIFQLIGLQRKTGILTLQSEIDTVTVTFLDGKIVGSESVEKKFEDRLGRVLVKRGYISEEQLDEALVTQRETLQRLGYILIKNNVLSQAELKKALHDQINQILFRLFRWKEGYYHFRQEKTVHFDRENIIPISAENILMAGVQIVDEWPRIEKKIPSFDLVFVKSELPPGTKLITREHEEAADYTLLEEAVEDVVEEELDSGPDNVMTLSQEEKMAYTLVDGERSVQAIIDACHQGEFETLKALFNMLNVGLIEFAESEMPEKIEEEFETKRLASLKQKFIYAGVLVVFAVVVIFLPINPISAVMNAADSIGIMFNPTIESDVKILEDINRLRTDRIHFSLQMYYLMNRSFPATLEVLVSQKYITEQDTVDIWGNPFQLTTSQAGFQLRSIGPDRTYQTSDDIVIEESIRDIDNKVTFFPGL